MTGSCGNCEGTPGTLVSPHPIKSSPLYRSPGGGRTKRRPLPAGRFSYARAGAARLAALEDDELRPVVADSVEKLQIAMTRNSRVGAWQLTIRSANRRSVC